MADQVVSLVCPSHKWGEAVGANGTFRVRCTGKFCRRDGQVTRHTFDLATGVMKTHYVPYRNPRELLGTGRK